MLLETRPFRAHRKGVQDLGATAVDVAAKTAAAGNSCRNLGRLVVAPSRSSQALQHQVLSSGFAVVLLDFSSSLTS